MMILQTFILHPYESQMKIYIVLCYIVGTHLAAITLALLLSRFLTQTQAIGTTVIFFLVLPVSTFLYNLMSAGTGLNAYDKFS